MSIRLLVIDDGWGRDATKQRELKSKAAGLCEPELEWRFATGQREEAGRRVNDVALAIQAVVADGVQWSLVLLDMQFDSGMVDDYGVAKGSPGDDVFGLSIERHLLDRDPTLPLMRFTSAHEKDLGPDEKGTARRPFLSKDGLDVNRLRLALVEYGRLDFETKAQLLGIPEHTVVASPAMLALYTQAYRFAQTEQAVLLRGETGTGKEHLARFIHNASKRHKGPFEAVNVASYSIDLIESELFGHAKGSFTGAAAARMGAFARAANGTLFLDEVGALALHKQPVLLRVLQERRYTPVGANTAEAVNCGVIAATQDDVQAMIGAGTFRADLFSRFHQVLTLPPLRQRPEDIRPLAKSMLAWCQASNHKKGLEWSEEALSLLERSPLQRNVRDIETAINLAVGRLSNNSVIRAEDLDLPVQPRRADPRASTHSTSDDESQAQALELPASGSSERSVTPSPRVSLDPVQPLSDSLGMVLQGLRSFHVDGTSTFLNGALPLLDDAWARIRRDLAYAALERCRHPVNGKVKIQTAMQFLAGQSDLTGMNAKRLLNALLGHVQSRPIDPNELDVELKRRFGDSGR